MNIPLKHEEGEADKRRRGNGAAGVEGGGLVGRGATSLFFTGPIFVQEGQAEKREGSSPQGERASGARGCTNGWRTSRVAGGKGTEVVVDGGEECTTRWGYSRARARVYCRVPRVAACEVIKINLLSLLPSPCRHSSACVRARTDIKM